MSELKPCPFCGGTKICTEKSINLNYCDNCSAESNIEHWNTRPIEDALNKRIAELEKEIDVRKEHADKLLKNIEKLDAIGQRQFKRIAKLEEENEKSLYFIRELRTYCIWANWDNPDTEDDFNEFDVEVCKWLSKFMEREE